MRLFEKLLLISILALFMKQNLAAQTITVVSEDDGISVVGTHIYSVSKNLGVVTDEDGVADVSSLAGSDTLLFKYLGFKDKRIAFATAVAMRVITLRPTTLLLQETVVGASRFRENRDDVPQTIEVISARAISYENAQTTADLLSNSGSVFVQKTQMGGGSPILRGFEANKVLLVLDGVRLNNAIYRAGHLQNAITVDQGVLERAEVILGPGSVIYGSDALGGVVHLRTKIPQLLKDGKKKLAFHTNSYTRYATANNELTGHIDFSLGLKKWASLTSITFSDFKDLRMGNVTNPFSNLLARADFYVERIGGVDTMIVTDNRNTQKYTGYNQTDFLQKFLFRSSSRFSHTVAVHFSTSSEIPRYDRLVETSGALPKYAEWSYGPQLRVLGSYGLSTTTLSKFADYVQAVVAYQRIQESRITRRFGSDIRETKVEDVDVVSINADLSKQMKKHLVRFGLEATYNHVASSGSSLDIVTEMSRFITSRYPEGGTNTYSAAAYVTDTWSFAKQWKLNGGIRFSYYGLESTFGDSAILDFGSKKLSQSNGAVNGSVGILWRNKGWTISLLASSGFRSPNLDDLGKVFDPRDGVLVVPNPDLKPTYLYSIEMAIRKSLGNKGQIEVVGYYSHMVDAIVNAPYSYQGQDSVLYGEEVLQLFANQNKQQAYVAGVSSNLALSIYKGLAATASVAYTYGRILTDTTPAPLDHIPPLFGKVGVQHQWKRLRTEVYFNWSTWKKLEDYNIDGSDKFSSATVDGMPAWYTLNFRASYGIIPSIKVQLAIENIFDQNYRMYGSAISAVGRNFLITLRANL